MDLKLEPWWQGVPAAVTTGLLGIAGTSLAWWLKQRKGKYIDVVPTEHATLVAVSPAVRNKIETKYDGKVVKELSMRQLTIRNSSADTIKGIAITIRLAKEAVILVADCTLSTSAASSVDVNGNSATICIDRLNSFRFHKDNATVTILCDGDAKEIDVVGNGDGWSARQIKPWDGGSIWSAGGRIVGIGLLIMLSVKIQEFADHTFPQEANTTVHTLLSMISGFGALCAFALMIFFFIDAVVTRVKQWFGR